jgi:hypothetical protein
MMKLLICTEKVKRLLALSYLLTIVIVSAFFTIGLANATTIHVPSDQPNIQDAINIAVDGDTVLIAPGTYVETLDFLGKAITVTSEDGATTTVIDGFQEIDDVHNIPVVMFVSGEGRGSVLSGLTVRGARSWDGGGIRIEHSSPTIIDNIITDNTGLSPGGGGIVIWGGRPLIQSNLITNNEATYGGRGGGIWIIFAQPEIVDNEISHNTADFSGGGIYIDSMVGGLIQDNRIVANTVGHYSQFSSGGGIGIRAADGSIMLPSRITQNLIFRNIAPKGGGIALDTPYHTSPLIMQNTIAENSADIGSAFYADGFNDDVILVNNNIVGSEGEGAFACGLLGFNTPIMAYNNVFSRSGEAFSEDCIDPTGSIGNISVDPRFIDPLNDDFHLGSRSPLLEAGLTIDELPATDFDGNPRVVDIDNDGDAEVDIGVYERFLAIPVDLSGTIKTSNGNDICAMVLASGQHMFSCNPWGEFSLTDLPRRSDGTVKRQIYAHGFFPKIDVLTGSSIDEAVVMTRSGTCPNYNVPSDPGFFPDSVGKWIDISGSVEVGQNGNPVCAMVLASGQHMFSCDGTGSYDLHIPLNSNGQYKLQVYADGFAPAVQKFDEFSTNNVVKMARATECQAP